MKLGPLLILSAFLFSSPISAFSQVAIDSLLSTLGYKQVDAEAILKLYDYIYSIELEEPERAFQLYEAGSNQSEEIGFSLGAAKGVGYQGAIDFNLGRFDAAIAKYNTALGIADTATEVRFKAAMYNNIGNAYNIKGEFAKGIENLQKASLGFAEVQDTIALIINKSNIGSILTRTANYAESIQVLEEALVLARAINENYYLGDVYNNLGNVYQNQEDYPTSIEYFFRAYHHYQLGAPSDFVALALGNIAQGFLFMEDMDSTKKYIKLAKEIVEQNDIPRQKAFVYGIAGTFLAKQGNYVQAEREARTALNISGNIDDPLLRKNAVFAMIAALEGRKNFKAAAPYYQEYIELSDSLGNLERNQQLLTLRTQFQMVQKENEIAQLTKQKALDELSIHRQRTISIGALAALLLVIGIAYFFYRTNQQTRLIASQEKVIQEQKLIELKEKQKVESMTSMLNGQEQERIRISKDLHDGLGGSLAGIKMRLEAYNEEKEATDFHTQTIELVDWAYEEVRRISHDLNPYILNKFGLQKAIEHLCESINSTGKIKVQFQALGELGGLSENHNLTVFRSVQELLNNVLKYAKAEEALVQVSKLTDRLEITVEDDGKGFDPQQVHTGMGLQSIASRAEGLGGNVSIDSKPNEGSSIFISLPI